MNAGRAGRTGCRLCRKKYKLTAMNDMSTPEPSKPSLCRRRDRVSSAKSKLRSSLVVWLVGLAVVLVPTITSLAQSGRAVTDFQAPTRLFPAPTAYDLVTMPGDLVFMRYSLGALDRAARLQLKLRQMLFAFQRWAGSELVMTVYVLTPEEWRASGINMP